MSFEFITAARIVLGRGAAGEIGAYTESFGDNALLLTGHDPSRASVVAESLKSAGKSVSLFPVKGEPTTESIEEAAAHARKDSCSFVVAVGGGSVIDTGKAVAALLSNGGELLDYLEVVGKGKPLLKPSCPFAAVPTTGGTGAEVTHNAVMQSTVHKVKVSMRNPHMFARLALVDPELALSCSPEVTAHAGLDALAQLIEPFVSLKSMPLTDALCRDGFVRVARSIRRACQQGDDMAAREDMAIAALYSGMALANAKLGAVHGFAGPLGGMFRGGHGALCAVLLAPVMDVNIRAMSEREPENPALKKYGEISRILTGKPDASMREGVAFLRDLALALKIQPLSVSGVREKDFPDIIVKAKASGSMQGNPVKLTDEELKEILAEALNFH
ncbi:MAG: iron-containing alcohol dehydrogenase [Vulcanimicrobiota bacterium]